MAKPILPPTLLTVHVEGEANYSGEHWSARHRRAKAQRQGTLIGLHNAYGLHRVTLLKSVPMRCLLTRVYGGRRQRIDEGDNLAMSFKHVRDEICAWLGIDDARDDLLCFECEQRGVLVAFYPRSAQRTLDTDDLRGLVAAAAIFVHRDLTGEAFVVTRTEPELRGLPLERLRAAEFVHRLPNGHWQLTDKGLQMLEELL
jgi:hypothetical protein